MCHWILGSDFRSSSR